MHNRILHKREYTRLFILRHAQTALNAEGKIQGETDIPLNHQGRQQAKKMAAYLARYYTIEHLFSSPFPRAQETAQIVSQRYGISTEINPDLIELQFGKINNQRFSELETIAPEYFGKINHIYDTSTDENISKPAFPEGESTAAIQKRIEHFTNQLLEQHRGKCVAAVSHGGFIKYMLAYYAGIPLQQPIFFFIENASVSVVDFYQNRSIIMAINECGYLNIPIRYSHPSVL